MLLYPEKSRARRKQYVQHHSEDLGSEHKPPSACHPHVTSTALWCYPQQPPGTTPGKLLQTPNPQGNVQYHTIAVEPESLPWGEWFHTASMENCLSN